MLINEPKPVFLWGRSLDEYRQMFLLSETDLKSKILGCGDGPASFNAEMHQLSHRVVSADPIYALTGEQIRRAFDESHQTILKHCLDRPRNITWSYFSGPEHLGETRTQVMDRFLQDFPSGRQQQRYVARSLPHLEFPNRSFDLALCSHFLFLYSKRFSVEFHLQAIREMCRVAREVRIFPLVRIDKKPKLSRHVKPVIRQLKKEGFDSEIIRTPYEFLRGGNTMLKITPQKTPPSPKPWLRRLFGA